MKEESEIYLKGYKEGKLEILNLIKLIIMDLDLDNAKLYRRFLDQELKNKFIEIIKTNKED